MNYLFILFTHFNYIEFFFHFLPVCHSHSSLWFSLVILSFFLNFTLLNLWILLGYVFVWKDGSHPQIVKSLLFSSSFIFRILIHLEFISFLCSGRQKFAFIIFPNWIARCLNVYWIIHPFPTSSILLFSPISYYETLQRKKSWRIHQLLKCCHLFVFPYTHLSFISSKSKFAGTSACVFLVRTFSHITINITSRKMNTPIVWSNMWFIFTVSNL